MLKNKNIKIISLASYDNYHFKQVISCLNNNKNVFVEKPLCMFKHELKKFLLIKKKQNFYYPLIWFYEQIHYFKI